MKNEKFSRRDFLKFSGAGLLGLAAAPYGEQLQSLLESENKLTVKDVRELNIHIEKPCGTRAFYRSPGGEITIVGTEDSSFVTSSGTYACWQDGPFFRLPIPESECLRKDRKKQVPRDIIPLPNGNFLIGSDHVATRFNPETGECVNIFDYINKVENNDRFAIQTAIVYGDYLVLAGYDFTQGLKKAKLSEVQNAKTASDINWEWIGNFEVEPFAGLIMRDACVDPLTGDLLLTAFDGGYPYYEKDSRGFFNFSQRDGTGVISLNRDLNMVPNPYNQNKDVRGNIPVNVIYPYKDGVILGNERPAIDKNGDRTTNKLLQIYDTRGALVPDNLIDTFGLILAGKGDTVSIRGIQVIENQIFVAINGGNLVTADLSVLNRGQKLSWQTVLSRGVDGRPLEALGTTLSINSQGNYEIGVGRYPNGDKFTKPVIVTLQK